VNRERIRTAREARGWSMDEAGSRAGFEGPAPGPPVEQDRERHVGRPADLTLYRVAKALGLELTEILVDPPRGEARRKRRG
jgi:transcriptional regulator with XRE-family HTH domain